MAESLSVSQAADELGLDPSRVRALVAGGQLEGHKVGGRWLVDRRATHQRKLAPRAPGRPFEPHNAWALIFLAGDLEAPWLNPASRSRLRRSLRQEGLVGLRPRLIRRANGQRFSAHPGELPHLLADRHVVPSGISAASSHGLGLVSGVEADGYVRASALDEVRRRHALNPALDRDGNVLLRVVPDAAWRLGSDDRPAPLAAVALDLADDLEPRSTKAGLSVLREIDRATGPR